MNPRFSCKHLVFLILALTFCGCDKLKPQEPIPLAEAEQKFAGILKDEFKIEPVIKKSNNTLWVYVPLPESIMKMAATPEGPQKSGSSEERPTIKYLETSYENGRFLITYDIRQDIAYAQSPGYRVDYTPVYQKTSQNILTAVTRAYFQTTEPPLFFIMVIADIQNGVEIETIFYLEDLRKYMSMEAIPQEEFVKRNIYDIRGRTAWIGDTGGRHLSYQEILMPEFLARQITGRVNFKYQKSSFPPSSNARTEILSIVKETLGNYDFKDFNYIELHDRQAGFRETVPPAELNALPAPPAKQ